MSIIDEYQEAVYMEQMSGAHHPRLTVLWNMLCFYRLYLWCRLFDHRWAETYADPESGQTEVECQRCHMCMSFYITG